MTNINNDNHRLVKLIEINSVIAAYEKNRRLRNINNLFLVSLAVCDCFIGSISMSMYRLIIFKSSVSALIWSDTFPSRLICLWQYQIQNIMVHRFHNILLYVLIVISASVFDFSAFRSGKCEMVLILH